MLSAGATPCGDLPPTNPMGGEITVPSFDEIRNAVHGREREVLDSLGLPWHPKAIHCPYPGHADLHPSWRFDERKRRAVCSCCGYHDIFEVVVKMRGGTIGDAFLVVAEILGLDTGVGKESSAERQRRAATAAALAEQHRKARDDEQHRNEQQRIQRGRGIWEDSEPIGGTLGEVYLEQTRKLQSQDGETWAPDVLRYNSRKRALVAAARNLASGEITAIHVVYLKENGGNLRETDEKGRRRNKKRTFGVRTGAVVRFPPTKAGRRARRIIAIAEGIETALSVWCASGLEVWATLGPIPQLKTLPRGVRVLLLRDDDAIGSPADTAIGEAFDRWRRQGFDVHLVLPWSDQRRQDKADFNNVAKEHGLAAVARRIAEAEALADKLGYAVDPQPLPSAAPNQVRQATIREIVDFVNRRHADKPPVRLLRSWPGVGKSQGVQRLLSSTVVFDKAKGERHKVITGCPTGKLARELAGRAEAMGLNAAFYDGRGDPDHPKQTDPCRNLRAVRAAYQAGVNVEHGVCGTLDGPHCRFRASCEWYKQRERCAKADVVFLAHNHLFLPLPREITDWVCMVVVEESFSQLGVECLRAALERTFGERTIIAAPDAGEAERTRSYRVHAKPKKKKKAEDETTPGPEYDDVASSWLDLHFGRWMRAIAAARETDGVITADLLRAAGIEDAVLVEAIGLNERRRPRQPPITPGMSLIAMEAAARNPVRRVVNNTDAILRAGLDLLRGVGAALRIDGDHLQLDRLKTAAAWIDGKGVIVLSATKSTELAQRFLPALEERATPIPRLEHQRLRLHLAGFGQDGTRRHLADLVARAKLAAAGGRKVGVICAKAVEHNFRGIANVETMHHGAVSGHDGFADVDRLMIVGGPMISAEGCGPDRLGEGPAGDPVAAIRARAGERPAHRRHDPHLRADGLRRSRLRRGALLDPECRDRAGDRPRPRHQPQHRYAGRDRCLRVVRAVLPDRQRRALRAAWRRRHDARRSGLRRRERRRREEAILRAVPHRERVRQGARALGRHRRSGPPYRPRVRPRPAPGQIPAGRPRPKTAIGLGAR